MSDTRECAVGYVNCDFTAGYSNIYQKWVLNPVTGRYELVPNNDWYVLPRYEIVYYTDPASAVSEEAMLEAYRNFLLKQREEKKNESKKNERVNRLRDEIRELENELGISKKAKDKANRDKD